MIEISRKNRKPLIIEEATTVKEAVEYAVRNQLSLEGAGLFEADLTGADLSHANLSGANIDYSCLPLWCGSLDVKNRQAAFLPVIVPCTPSW